jgi:hypothetical protein
MDPRERADAALARARARGGFVVTPESAISPMDAASTLQIPRSVVSAIDRADNDPEATMVVPVVPAIAQEASTQALPSPARPAPRPPTVEETPTPPMSWAPPKPPPPPPEPEHLEGLVPTVKQPPVTRSSLSQRLDG